MPEAIPAAPARPRAGRPRRAQQAPGLPLPGADQDAAPGAPHGPPQAALAELVSDRAQTERDRIAAAKRDAAGFVTDALPHITAQQLRWLTYRLESGDNQEACESSGIDPLEVLAWMGDPGFLATYQAAIENKREGFKTLTSHLLPAVIRSLHDMLETGSNKDRKEASLLILRAQGLLIDKAVTADPQAINALFSLLREERPVEARILSME